MKLNALTAAYASSEVLEIADAVKKAAIDFDVSARTLEQDRLTDGVAKAREDVRTTRKTFGDENARLRDQINRELRAEPQRLASALRSSRAMAPASLLAASTSVPS